MNFSDKVKGEEFMNLPEVEDDIEEEYEEEDEDFPSFMEFMKDKLPSKEEEIELYTDRADVKLAIFMHLEEELKNLGYEDKEERMRIIEILM